jgi:hypothetical protein
VSITTPASGAFGLVFTCSVCDSQLVDDPQLQACLYCGEEEETDWVCPRGHYVCESCRSASPAELVERFAPASAEADPMATAELLMKHPSFNANGPEHHLVVAPAILSALRKQGVSVTDARFRAALTRMADIPVAVCGTRGDCGAAAGAGCAVSLLTGATFRSKRERTLALLATARALVAVAAHGGPRCCKQSVFASIQSTAVFLQDELGISLPVADAVRCAFSEKNPECTREACAYFSAE